VIATDIEGVDYLVDTSVLSGLLDPGNSHHEKVTQWIGSLNTKHRLLVSVVAIAEMCFGRQLAIAANSKATLPNLDRIINEAEKMDLLSVTTPTAIEYAKLKANLAQQTMPKRIAQRKKTKWGNPESWRNEYSGTELHIQENDLWQSAQAIERELKFVTTDS
tara:strand:- start:38 stop:523 length:486 start_codon:yes stop_codon:yes gene_type:complete